MRPKSLFVSVAVAGAMWLTTSAAHAYGFNTNVTFTDSNPGSFNVLIQHLTGTNNGWKITVKSLGSGTPGQFPNLSPEHNVHQMGFQFFNTASSLYYPTTIAGSTGSGSVSNAAAGFGLWGGSAGTNPINSQAATPQSQYFWFTNNQKDPVPGPPYNVQSPYDLQMNASNTFVGYLNLADNPAFGVNSYLNVNGTGIRMFNGVVTNGAAIADARIQDAPEGAGLLLLFPALAPVGLVLRGKIRRTNPAKAQRVATV